MAELTQAEIAAYLAEVHVAHLVTVRRNGRPHVAPVWFVEEDGRALVIAGANAIKVRNIRRNPVVSLSIATDLRPFQYVVLEGEVQVTDDDLTSVVERICVRYDGQERGRAFAEELLAGGQTVVIDIRVSRVLSWKDDE